MFTLSKWPSSGQGPFVVFSMFNDICKLQAVISFFAVWLSSVRLHLKGTWKWISYSEYTMLGETDLDGVGCHS